MGKYFYSALKNNKQIIKGEIEAASPREAREKIRQLGYIPTKVYIENYDISGETMVHNNVSPTYSAKRIKNLSLNDKILFTSELQVMLSSGIPILEALHVIESNTPKLKLRQLSNEIKEYITNKNMTFSQALETLYGEVFGPVYTGLCISGEAAGELDVTLERILTLLRKQASIKSKIISASIYPAILIAIMFGLMLLFSKLVFPAFAGVMAFNGQSLPFLATFLVTFFNLFSNLWFFGLISLIAAVFTFKTLLKDKNIKRNFDNFLLNIPVLSEFIKYVNLSNFMSVLEVSYEAGVPIMESLILANKTVHNIEINNKVFNALNFVKQGKSLSEAFSFVNLLPPDLLVLISTGEKSGKLGKMLKDMVMVIDKKVDMVLETLTKLFEPACIIIIGAFVLVIAIAFYQSYFGMIGSFF